MITEISAALAVAKNAKDLVVALSKATKEFDKAELRLQVVELVNQITELNSKLLALRERLSARDSVVYIDGVWWTKGQENKGDPYSPLCLEKDEKPIHMHSHEIKPGPYQAGYSYWKCISCKTTIQRNDKPMIPPGGSFAPSAI